LKGKGLWGVCFSLQNKKSPDLGELNKISLSKKKQKKNKQN
jgi:hypothetical protein